jgi:hypothetical protein
VEVANKEKSYSLLKLRTGYNPTIKDLLSGITIALVEDRNEVQVTSLTKASATVFQVMVAPADVGRSSEKIDEWLNPLGHCYRP